MKNILSNLRRIMVGVPLAAIIMASMLPLQIRAQQALVMFILIWFNAFLIFDVIFK